MSSAIVKTQESGLATWTPEQKELIKRTVAPNASDDELAMFLHVAAVSGLDPLRKQIHFTKMGGRIAFIADINGLQARAAREADFEGILHAVVYEKDDFVVDGTTGQIIKHMSNPLGANGRIVGAWATVRRKGMLPFTSIVRFNEYDNPNNPMWKTKPGVMIDKCAKSTALRLAYPEQLGGIYERAEIDKEEREEKDITPVPAANVDVPQPRTKALAEKVAAKLQPKMQIIDESTPQAEVPPLPDDFGPGDDLTKLTDLQLTNRKGYLMAKGGKRAEAKLNAILAEEERRMASAGGVVSPEPLPTGDIPF